MRKLIDLHIHTNFSDGVLSSKEVIEEAYRNHVFTIAIADHDTQDGYTDELFKYAKDKGITLIPAVEISTKMNKIGIHVLGYNFDIDNKELRQKLLTLRNSRHDYLFKVSKKLQELGYSINIHALEKIEAVTKAHTAIEVINDTRNKELLFKTFGHLPSKGEFIETIMNEGCPAYVAKETITPKEASILIKQAGGKVILAHPVAYTYEDNLTDSDILKLIEEMEADGIEANYLYIDRTNKKINDCSKWNNIAKENKLLTTIGSDFHDQDNLHPKIGLIGENLEIDNNAIEQIIFKLLN